MPLFGLGTYKMDSAETMTKAATELGYRLYDCASFYKNEEVVGQALKEVTKTIAREQLFVVSKVWWDEVEDVESACKRSLQKLGVDYLDLYLVHWPVAVRDLGDGKYERIKIPMYKIWAQMEALVDKGLVKSIGVSNFNVQLMWDMLSYARIPPACNEVELHPLCSQPKLLKFMKDHQIVPIAYCPIGRGADTSRCPNIFEHPAVVACMAKHGKTGAQILLNWGLLRGCVVIPKSNSIERIKENIESTSFNLD